jgi:hypothetical protein
MWYAAHLIMSLKYDEPGDQTVYPIWENVVLIRADSDEDAERKATRIGREDEESGDEKLRWDGKPAHWVFAGVRKLIQCRTPDDPDDRLRNGTEVTYSQMILDSPDGVSKLVRGEPVHVLYEE